MACAPPLAGFRHPSGFRPYRSSRPPPSIRHWKMGHFIHKSSVWPRLYGRRSCILSVRAMASEPALQNTEPDTKKRPRWQLHETMVLIAAKKKQELKLAGRKNDFKTSGEKWQEVEMFCQQNGIERTAQQCRYRWERIMAIYSKIKEWEERKFDNSSFWLMKPDERKAEGFQHGLDQETFKALDELYSKTRSKRLSTTASDSSKHKGVEEHANFDSTSLSHEVNGKQQAVHAAEMEDCSGDTLTHADISSTQQHISTPEAPKTEVFQEDSIPTYESTFWLMKSTHSNKESFEDGLKYDEKISDNGRPTAIANTINESLDHLRDNTVERQDVFAVTESERPLTTMNYCRSVSTDPFAEDIRKQTNESLVDEGKNNQLEENSVGRQDMFAVTESEHLTTTMNLCRSVSTGRFAEVQREAIVGTENIRESKNESLVDCTVKGKNNQFKENSVERQNMFAVTESERITAAMSYCRCVSMGPFAEDSREAIVGTQDMREWKNESPVDCTEKGRNNQVGEIWDVHDQHQVANMHYRTDCLPQDNCMLHHLDDCASKSTEDTCNEEGEKALVDEHGSSHAFSSMACNVESSSMLKGLNTAGFEHPPARAEKHDVCASKSTEDICNEGREKALDDEHGSSHVCSPMASNEESSSMLKGLNTAGFENPPAHAEERDVCASKSTDTCDEDSKNALVGEHRSSQSCSPVVSHEESLSMLESLNTAGFENTPALVGRSESSLSHDIRSDCPVNRLNIQGSAIKSVNSQTSRGQESNASYSVGSMEINTNIGRGLTVNANPSIEHSSIRAEREDCSGQKESESSKIQEQYLSASNGAHHKEEVAGIAGTVLDFENVSPHKRLEKIGDTYKETNENSKEISETSRAGSLSQQCKENVAGTKQNMKVAKDVNENPAKSMEGSQDGQCKKNVSNDYDDDVFTSVQAGVSRMIRNVVQTIGRFFRF